MKISIFCTRGELDLIASLAPPLAPAVPLLKPLNALKSTGEAELVNPDGIASRVTWEVEVGAEP